DAGHELRTPITVIRGHLELMGDDPAEREETRALLMEELDRMNRMVNDLIMLAKADRPDFLTVGEVDLADLTVDVVAKSRGLGDRRWRVGAVAEVRVLGDAQRLTQALMQLASNAVRHTADGDTIEVGSAVRGESVLLWVRDGGPGVAPEDAERIFERFVRGGRAARRARGRTAGPRMGGARRAAARGPAGRGRGARRPPHGRTATSTRRPTRSTCVSRPRRRPRRRRRGPRPRLPLRRRRTVG